MSFFRIIVFWGGRFCQQALQEGCPELPNLGLGGGMHLPLVKEAFRLKDRLEQEKRITELLKVRWCTAAW